MKKLLLIAMTFMLIGGVAAVSVDGQNDLTITEDSSFSSAQVLVDGEEVANESDFEEVNSQSVFNYDTEPNEYNVEVILDGKSEFAEEVLVHDTFVEGREIIEELSVSVDGDEAGIPDGRQSSPGLQHPDEGFDGSQAQGHPRTVVEAYSKIALLEGHVGEHVDGDESVEVVWDGTVDLNPFNDPWDRVHRNTGGDAVDSFEFSNNIYEVGDYTYIMYLASGESHYNEETDQWESPEEDGSTYRINQEDVDVYPFTVEEPEEPPSIFEELQVFFNSNIDGILNLFR